MEIAAWTPLECFAKTGTAGFAKRRLQPDYLLSRLILYDHLCESQELPKNHYECPIELATGCHLT